MTKEKIEKILVLILKIGLYASLIIPFITFPAFLYPFVFTKTLLFQILIEVLLVIYIPLILVYPQYRPNIKTPVTLGLLVFFGSMALSTVFSADIRQSFWGIQERGTGLFTLFHFLAYYFIFISVFKQPRNFLRIAVASATIMAGYALYQTFFIIGIHERATTTFGNPGYAGAYLMFFVYFAVLAILKEKKKPIKAAAIVAFLIILTALIFNSTRAVFLGIIGSLVATLIFIPLRGGAFNKRLYIGAVAGCAFIVIFIVVTITGALPQVLYDKVQILARLRGISVFDNTRVLSWKAGLQGMMGRPFFGYGPENYSIPFNKHYDPKLISLSYFKGSLNFDKAHNQHIEHLVNEGFIGFLGYLFFWAALFFTLWQARKERATLVLATLFIAYFIHNAFTFDTPITYFLLIISLGLIPQREEPAKAKQDKYSTVISPAIIALTLPILIIIFTLSIVFLNVRVAYASNKAATGNAAAQSSADPNTVFSYYYEAVEYKTVYSFDIARLFAMDVLSRISADTELEYNEVNYIIETLKKTSKFNWHNLALIGRGYIILCEKDNQYCDLAKSYLEASEELAPNRYQVYTEKYLLYMRLGNYKEAKQAIERAFQLGYEGADAADFYANLGYLYGAIEEYKTSLKYYEKALELKPDSIATLESIALLKKKTGDIEGARKAAEKMIELDPSLKERAGEFLEMLEL